MTDLLKPTKRRYVFAIYLATGYLAWGREFRHGREQPFIGRHRRHSTKRWSWPLCCGHVMSDAEVKAWKEAGLVIDGPPTYENTPSIVAGPELEAWTAKAFERIGMRADRYSNSASPSRAKALAGV